MVFSSHIFLFYFLPLSLALYYGMPRRGKNLLLTLLSYVFYGWSNPLFIVLLLISTTVDYACGRLIGQAPPGSRKRLGKIAVALSVITNLSILGTFKYLGFGLENFRWLLAAAGLHHPGIETGLRFVLPLGISFYTFQSMSYTIDVYRGEARFRKNFIDFACFVSMFPQLVAGPILRFQEVADQLLQRRHTLEKFSRGVAIFCLGMSKKVLLANPCGKIADTAFETGALFWWDAWYGVTAYAFQIYFDFSGYSDMAIGLGLMFGFVFPKNFDAPYRSASITEFWRRWHISLSTWLREYLYFPLGGNRKGSARTAANLFIVMFLGGLWHGASWNFVIWGLIHGALLAAERISGKQPWYRKLPKPLPTAFTFVLVLFAWVFFRAETLSQALVYLSSMLGLTAPPETSLLVQGIIYQPYYLTAMATAAVVTWWAPQSWEWTRELTAVKTAALFGGLLLSVVLLTLQSYNPFIYFNF